MQMMKVMKRNNCHLILTINHRSGVYDLRSREGTRKHGEKWCFPVLGNIYSSNRLIASTSVTGCVMRAGFNVDAWEYLLLCWRNYGFKD